MGIDLGDVVVRRETTAQGLAGKRLAFDAWNILYQFLASIRGPDGAPLTDKSGRVTSHLAGVLYRTGALVEAGIKPVFVFDGAPHELKGETLAERAARKVEAQAAYDVAVESGDLETARTKAQQTSRLTVPMADEAMTLLRALGIPVVQAPGEGEAQASWMAATGQVDGVVSQDFDSILFGAPLLVRNLSTGGRRKLPGKQVWVDVQPETIDAAESLAALSLSRQQLVDAAILVGTDFHPGIKGIGAKGAIKLIAADGSLDALLARLSVGGAKSAAERAIVEQMDNLVRRDAVRALLLDPPHTACDITSPPFDAAAVRRFMVDERGFSAERVDTALQRFATAKTKAAQRTLF